MVNPKDEALKLRAIICLISLIIPDGHQHLQQKFFKQSDEGRQVKAQDILTPGIHTHMHTYKLIHYFRVWSFQRKKSTNLGHSNKYVTKNMDEVKC